MTEALKLLKTAQRLRKKLDDDTDILIPDAEFLSEWAELNRDLEQI